MLAAVSPRPLRFASWLFALASAALLPACPGPDPAPVQGPSADAELSPPIAKRVAHELVAHGHTRQDPYYWLRDRDDPEVLAYLDAENAYTEAMTASSEGLRAALLTELTGRIKQDDASVPVERGGYLYYSRWRAGADYPLYCRKQGSLEAEEQVVLDVDALASEHAFFELTIRPSARTSACSPTHRHHRPPHQHHPRRRPRDRRAAAPT